MIFDLDPDEDLRWRDVVDASVHVRDVLEALGLDSFVKTTGGKGVHIVVPLIRRRPCGPMFAASAGRSSKALAAPAPQRFTANMAKRSRRGRIFVDYHRNRPRRRRRSPPIRCVPGRARRPRPRCPGRSWGRLDDPADLNWASVPERLGRSSFFRSVGGPDSSARALPKPERGRGPRYSRTEIEAVEQPIRPHIRRTPVIEVDGDELGLAPVRLVLKLELLQHAGSFKTRGAFANLLMRPVPEAGVVAASGGNHGAAVAYAAMRLGVPARIFVPP